MTLSYKQITEGNFTIFDSNTGKEVTPSSQPTVFLAYEEDGNPIGEDLGPLRLGIMTSNTQVAEGHWWVKWAQKIEVIAVQKPWTLKLEGAITEDMDQSTFESGATIGCHGVKYTDADGHVWEGIPLWYLIGRVDDPTETHKGDAFSDALADEGYEVQLIASDGYTVTLASADTKRNDGMIVAYKMDSNPLTDKNWPLRLVGSVLTKQQQVGGIVTMKLVFPTASTTPTTPSTPPVTESTALTVTNGSRTQTYTMTELKALSAITGYAGEKNKQGVVTGPVSYKGIALMYLLNGVGGLTASNSVVITAKDGFTKTLTYQQVTEGNFTTYDKSGATVTPEMKPTVFLAYEKEGAALDETTGPLRLGIMTCQNQATDSSMWVKMVERIEVIAAQ